MCKRFKTTEKLAFSQHTVLCATSDKENISPPIDLRQKRMLGMDQVVNLLIDNSFEITPDLIEKTGYHRSRVFKVGLVKSVARELCIIECQQSNGLKIIKEN